MGLIAVVGEQPEGSFFLQQFNSEHVGLHFSSAQPWHTEQGPEDEVASCLSSLTLLLQGIRPWRSTGASWRL